MRSGSEEIVISGVGILSGLFVLIWYVYTNTIDVMNTAEPTIVPSFVSTTCEPTTVAPTSAESKKKQQSFFELRKKQQS